jgi:hypothetical protein|tara:strand:+ start:140 stop:460 length:321 start_codon:yes stop_codon:yes gene_type:complete
MKEQVGQDYQHLAWVDPTLVVDGVGYSLRVNLLVLLLLVRVDIRRILHNQSLAPVMCQEIGLIFRLAMDFLRQKQLLLLNRRGRVYLVGVQQKVLQPIVVNQWVVD